MHRIDSNGAVAVQPSIGAVGDTVGYFSEGNPSLNELATVVSQDWLNAIQEELVAIVEAAGLSLDKPTNTQVRDAILSLLSSPSAGGLTQTLTANGSVSANVTRVFIDCTSGNVTVTLPSGSTGREIEFIRKDSTSNIATISRAGSDTIVDGSTTSVELMGQGNKLKLIRSSGVWY